MRVPFRPSRAILIVALASIVAFLPAYIRSLATTVHVDFNAFWCAGAAVRLHQNPYLDLSLHGCELGLGLFPPVITVPAPYPPYVMPLFAALSLLPAPASYWVWCALLIAAGVLTTVALTRLTSLPWSVTAAATAALVLVPSLYPGQLLPLCVCAFAWALLFMREGRVVAACAALAITAILPSFGIVAWIAAFASAPRARMPLVLTGGALLTIGLLAIGPHAALQYVTAVLPAHARSEVRTYWQLGSATVLHTLGVPEATAVPLADGLFALSVVLGIFVGMGLRARYGGDDWVPATATAFAVIGSPFVHGPDLGFALPLALLLLPIKPVTAATAIAVMLVIVPWQHIVYYPGVQAGIVIPFVLILADAVTGGRPVMTLAIIAVIGALATFKSPDVGISRLLEIERLPVRTLPADALAEERWAAAATANAWVPTDYYARIPPYAGLLMLLGIAVRRTTSRENAP
jgi:hypothetical protein